jgi:hypothetical protein
LPCVTWKPITGNYYAYLDTCRYDRTAKKPRSTGVYLGSTPEKAAAKLRLLVSEEEYPRLEGELYRKRPQGRPPRSEEEKVARQLKRLLTRYSGSEKVQRAVRAALAVLEGSETRENGGQV